MADLHSIGALAKAAEYLDKAMDEVFKVETGYGFSPETRKLARAAWSEIGSLVFGDSDNPNSLPRVADAVINDPRTSE